MADGVTFLVVLGLLGLFLVVFPLLVFLDAQDNSTDGAFAWAVAVFFGGPLGLVAYWLLGRDGGTTTATREDLPPQYR